MSSEENKPVDRRRFFRLGLSELLRPLAKAAKPLERMIHEMGKLDQPEARPEVWLRPPGSLAEAQFRQTCQRNGDCVRACPVQAIQMDRAKAGGVPFIDADFAACVVCSGLQCMSVCPSGALRPTSINDIDMGTAVWHSASCVRTRGQDCTICIDKCPLGSAAIELKADRVAVNPLGCVGCGVCQLECPTDPKSIVVIPIAAKTAK
ncbi:MAG: 4Fe-4S dicluster domain-containing protein [Tepidisphaeraceae bacterium]|jgi:MauM/NapG family ferredoxin protein